MIIHSKFPSYLVTDTSVGKNITYYNFIGRGNHGLTITILLICCRSHYFDNAHRKKKAPKRKSGTIGNLSSTARGSQGVRAYHRCNEEKILAHRRAGIDLNLE